MGNTDVSVSLSEMIPLGHFVLQVQCDDEDDDVFGRCHTGGGPLSHQCECLRSVDPVCSAFVTMRFLMDSTSRYAISA